MEQIGELLRRCDLFISIGTSGIVYPAAALVAVVREACAHTVELNLGPSSGATVFAEAIYGPATKIVPACCAQLLNRTASA